MGVYLTPVSGCAVYVTSLGLLPLCDTHSPPIKPGVLDSETEIVYTRLCCSFSRMAGAHLFCLFIILANGHQPF